MGVNYIARISKPGYSVYDPDPKNFSFREDTNSPKAFIRGRVFIVPYTYYTPKAVVHNLNRHVLSRTYIYDNSTGRMYPGRGGIAYDDRVEFPLPVAENIEGATIYYDIFYEGGA
jgi:hypothetical protein